MLQPPNNERSQKKTPMFLGKALVALAGVLCQVDAWSKHTPCGAASSLHAKEVPGDALG